MGYRNLRECVTDLERTGQIVRIDEEIDPYLEAAAIHRRVYASSSKLLSEATFYSSYVGEPRIVHVGPKKKAKKPPIGAATSPADVARPG